MNKKYVALVFIALLLGLGEGYVIYQNKNLNDRLNAIEMMDWHQAYFIREKYPTCDIILANKTDNFLIKGESVRIVWTAMGHDLKKYGLEEYFSAITIFIYYSNGTLYSTRGSSGKWSAFACDLKIDKPNTEYYLEIDVVFIEWFSVTIWDYY